MGYSRVILIGVVGVSGLTQWCWCWVLRVLHQLGQVLLPRLPRLVQTHLTTILVSFSHDHFDRRLDLVQGGDEPSLDRV